MIRVSARIGSGSQSTYGIISSSVPAMMDFNLRVRFLTEREDGNCGSGLVRTYCTSCSDGREVQKFDSMSWVGYCNQPSVINWITPRHEFPIHDYDPIKRLDSCYSLVDIWVGILIIL